MFVLLRPQQPAESEARVDLAEFNSDAELRSLPPVPLGGCKEVILAWQCEASLKYRFGELDQDDQELMPQLLKALSAIAYY